MPIWRGTTSTDWNTASNWVVDGLGNNGVPTATTDAIFDSTSTNPCVLGADRVCRDLTFTAFPSTLTVATFNLTSYRSVTLQSNISSRIVGTTGTLRMAIATGGTAASGTLTSNGGTWPLNFSGGGAAITITLADNFICSGSATINTGTTYSGNTFSTNASFTSAGGGSLATSTTSFIMTGTGNLSLAGACNMELNTSGTITVIANIVTSRRFIITNVGTLNGLSSFNFTFQPVPATNTLDFGAGNRSVQDFTTNTGFNPLTILNSFTCRDLTLAGTLTCNGPTSPSTATITVTRSYTHSNTAITNGTLFIVMDGSSGGAVLNGNLTPIPVTINAGANTITLAASVTFQNGALLTRTSGNISVGTSTAAILANASATLNGMTFWNLTIPGLATITQNTSNTIQNNLTLASNGNVAFTGSAGWTCANLICTTISRTITLTNSSSGASYRTTTNAQLTATSANRITMASNNATTQSIWTLDNGAIQSLIYVNGTRIDSSQGQTIWSFGGTLVSASNWGTGSQPLTVANTFVC